MVRVQYNAPATVGRFLQSTAFVRCCVGPVGSGKSSGCVVEILRRAVEQAPSEDGIRRTRFAIIRNTYSQLRDTTRKTFEQWVPDALGEWKEQQFAFHIDFPHPDGTRVQSEVLFRALDRPEDVKKLLSLELTGAYINEAREIPKHILDVLETRVGRYPAKMQGGPTWFGIWLDTNPWHTGHWGYKLFSKTKPPGYELYEQPGGRSPEAENVENLPPGYYDRLCHGKDSEWVRSYVDGQYPSSDVGSIFGAWISQLEARGGLEAFDHPTDGVFTSWDLGRSDSTSIWFWRVNEWGVADVIDHYEAHGRGLSHFFDVVDRRGYEYERHWLPHDAKQKTLATQASVLDQCLQRWGSGKVAIAPMLAVKDGIAAARWLLEQKTRIHPRCTQPTERLEWSGVDALREYRFEWDEENRCFSPNPVHNWASHSADAFRYAALVFKHSELLTRKPAPAAPPRVEATLDDLWAEYERTRPTTRRI